jgi:hypothetical protein
MSYAAVFCSQESADLLCKTTGALECTLPVNALFAVCVYFVCLRGSE